MEMLLEVSALNAEYKKSQFRIKDININIPTGMILGLIGQNGAGKTTIFHTILDLKKKSSGDVKICGKQFSSNEIDLKENIGVVFDETYLPKILTANKISKIYKKLYKNWDENYFYTKLEKFNIDPTKKIKDYSKGMQKTLAIITVLSYHPQLLLLDEPTANLDPVRRLEVLELLQEFVENGENSILLSSHITSELERISDYVVFVKAGEIVLSSETEELIYNHAIIKCTHQVFDKIPENIIIAYEKQKHQHLVLVNDKDFVETLVGDYTFEKPTLDEVINLFSKGEIV